MIKSSTCIGPKVTISPNHLVTSPKSWHRGLKKDWLHASCCLFPTFGDWMDPLQFQRPWIFFVGIYMIYNQQFQGTIILMVFDLQGIAFQTIKFFRIEVQGDSCRETSFKTVTTGCRGGSWPPGVSPCHPSEATETPRCPAQGIVRPILLSIR